MSLWKHVGISSLLIPILFFAQVGWAKKDRDVDSMLAKASSLYLAGELTSALETLTKILSVDSANETALKLYRSIQTEMAQTRLEKQLRDELIRLQQEVDGLRLNLETAGQEARKSSEDRDRERFRADALDRDVATLEQQLQDANRRMTEKEEQVRAAHEDLGNCEETRKELGEARERLAALSERLEWTLALKQENADLAAKLEAVEEKIISLKSLSDEEDFDTVDDLVKGLVSQWRERQQRLAKALSELAQREGELEASQMVIADLRRGGGDLDDQKKITMMEENERLKDQIVSLKNAMKDKESSSEDRDVLRSNMEAVSAQRDTLQKTVTKLEARIQELEVTLASKTDPSIEEDQRKREEEVQALKDLLGHLRTQMEISSKQREELKRQVDALTRELTELRLRNAEKEAGKEKRSKDDEKAK